MKRAILHKKAGLFSPAAKKQEQAIGELGWPELKARVKNCAACKLRAGCTQTVFGVGDKKASWLFVGEGPGADEEALGEPFVGQAGKLLDKMLAIHTTGEPAAIGRSAHGG